MPLIAWYGSVWLQHIIWTQVTTIDGISPFINCLTNPKSKPDKE